MLRKPSGLLRPALIRLLLRRSAVPSFRFRGLLRIAHERKSKWKRGNCMRKAWKMWSCKSAILEEVIKLIANPFSWEISFRDCYCMQSIIIKWGMLHYIAIFVILHTLFRPLNIFIIYSPLPLSPSNLVCQAGGWDYLSRPVTTDKIQALIDLGLGWKANEEVKRDRKDTHNFPLLKHSTLNIKVIGRL